MSGHLARAFPTISIERPTFEYGSALLCTCVRSVDTWEEGYYEIKRILDHRVVRGGELEYEVEWKPKKDGTPWRTPAGELLTEWKKAEEITPDVIEAYEAKRGTGVPSQLVTIDAALSYTERVPSSHRRHYGARQARRRRVGDRVGRIALLEAPGAGGAACGAARGRAAHGRPGGPPDDLRRCAQAAQQVHLRICACDARAHHRLGARRPPRRDRAGRWMARSMPAPAAAATWMMRFVMPSEFFLRRT